MNKENFLGMVNEKLNGMSLKEAKKVIYELSSKLEESKYEMALCIIDYIMGKQNNNDLTGKIEEIKKIFTKALDEDICVMCYEEPNGYYSGSFGEDYDLYFYPSNKLNDLLNETYLLGKSLIYNRQYEKAIEIFNLILDTDYVCEEISNPEYYDDDSILNIFDSSIENIETKLSFNLDYVYLYCIYANLMLNKENKFEMIHNYLKKKEYLNIKNSLNLGIEKPKNMDRFYQEFKEYLQDKNVSKEMIERWCDEK